ncbi:hydroxyacylglutathione hydrolase [Sphingomonas sp. MJ1 (PH-R8)]|uniref:hydroxyacylglutathione hydrolase n=1 Tax=Sphingomonas sp. MJ1 (PH-R8) TaxID=3112950 RepID=UPI003A89CDED
MAGAASPIEVVRLPALSDNYVWLLHDPASGEMVVVDPAEAPPVLAALAERGWTLTAIWNTHWHGDHTGGNAGLKEATGVPVFAPAAEAAKIPTLDHGLREGDTLRIGDHVATVLEVPAHTAGHIAFHFAEDALLFSGDMLFAMGAGRLFEGTAAQMYAAMRRFEALPDATQVFCGHEYTQSNGRYALAAEPDNAAVAERMVEVDRLRAAGAPTVPTTIGLERATNPFLRASSPEELAERRQAKDSFRG